MAEDRRSKQEAAKRARKPYTDRTRRAMLNVGQMVYFRNDLKEIMSFSDMLEKDRASFMATLTARASQRSIPEARQYIDEVEAREGFSKDTARRLHRLLDHYTKYR